MKAVPLDKFRESISLHRKGEIVKIDNVSEIPDINLRRLLEDQGIISIATIPLMREGECIGFVGFDSIKKRHIYTEYEQQLLQVYAQTIVNVKERLQKEQKLISAKEKAEESDRLKTAFLANMSHEIRTPMNGIIGFLDLLKEPDLSEENKADYINIVTQSGRRLLDTINDIIEISKIETGELKVNMSIVNVSELMTYYHGFFRQQTDQKSLNYIISNLLKNAVKFTSEGSVEFGCYLEESEIVFYVKDTGPGIPADQIAVIFDRFVQADLSSSRSHEGSGLGLSIVKAYVEMLNGKIQVKSKTGAGSCFSFSIPYYPSEEEKSVSEKTLPIPETSSVKSTILIAEDDYASFLYLQNLLSGKGVTFLHTTNGADTIKVVRENPDISLILMDLRMPGITGVEATRQIREFNKSIPVIAQTAYALSGDRELAIEAGCNDYIAKPINRSDLQRMVYQYISRKNN
jgi:signal transduction histidine kinase/CheY-like chemotaxis protein